MAMESSRAAACCLPAAGAGCCWLPLTDKPNQGLAAQNPRHYPGNPKNVCCFRNEKPVIKTGNTKKVRKRRKKKTTQKKPTLPFKGFLPICKYRAKHKRLPPRGSAAESPYEPTVPQQKQEPQCKLRFPKKNQGSYHANTAKYRCNTKHITLC